MSDHQFKYNSKVIAIPFLALFIIWFVYFIEIKFGFNFNKYGIYPKNILGLRGILFSPFIHSNVKHLLSNSVPLAVMLGSLYYFYYKIANKVLILGILISGLITWFIARPSFHIGASGVVYLLVSFIFFSGIFRKYYRLIALSLTVVFLYGSMVWYMLPVEERISWEGHLAGFITGFTLAIVFKKIGPQREKFHFTKDEAFDSLFDENGNYSPPLDKDDELNS